MFFANTLLSILFHRFNGRWIDISRNTLLSTPCPTSPMNWLLCAPCPASSFSFRLSWRKGGGVLLREGLFICVKRYSFTIISPERSLNEKKNSSGFWSWNRGLNRVFEACMASHRNRWEASSINSILRGGKTSLCMEHQSFRSSGLIINFSEFSV